MATSVPRLDDWLAARRREIEETLSGRLPTLADDPGRLVESMRYSLLAPGKRLRPILALAAAEATGGGGVPSDVPSSVQVSVPIGAPADASIRIAAAAVELIHCYSLIHDDLPAMDDDDFRRGKPSNHKVFGEATAILAGDALLTLAFEWIAEAAVTSGRPEAFARAALALARGAGVAGMVRGQARDLGEAAPPDVDALERLHGEKTAALFRAAVEVGAAAAGASSEVIAQIGRFGHLYGIAFQHADDLDDGDHAHHASRAMDRLRELVEEARASLCRLPHPEQAQVLGDLADALLASAPRG